MADEKQQNNNPTEIATTDSVGGEHPEVLEEIFRRLYSPEQRTALDEWVANIKSDLESVPDVDGFVMSRIKGPLSILKKVNGDSKYLEEWNTMKDLLGFMVVVDSNAEIDTLLYYMQTHFGSLKNPNAKTLISDFRKKPIREPDPSRKVIIDPPSPKGYQTNDGYKNVRINLMVVDYPVEIQVKTREQYIAHMATHDPVYKSKVIPDEATAHRFSDALFPYFEAYAHLKLKENEMTPIQIENCKKDMRAIFERNQDIYKQYPEVYNEACSIFAVYVFVMKNREQLYADAFLDDSVVNNQLLEAEILRIFHYKQKEMLKNDKTLTDSKAFMKTAEEIMSMSYEDYKKTSEKLAGEYRKELCIISGVFDMLKMADIQLIQRCAKSFRRVVVSVYDDDLAKLYLGTETMYSTEDRVRSLEMIDDVASVSVVGIDGSVKNKEMVEPFIIDTPAKKPYSIVFVPGVLDGLHAGHLEHLLSAFGISDVVIVGIKDDSYVIINKHKTPIQGEKERAYIVSANVCVDEVVITSHDILPPANVLQRLVAAAEQGERVAILLGSDWHKPETRAKKSPLSLAEYEMLTKNYPMIELIELPRGDARDKKGNKRSSSGYRAEAIERAKMINPLEITTLGV